MMTYFSRLKSQKKRGFTLIELLVVIAIIGILSTVVLAVLSPAREKAKRAKVLQGVDSLRKSAELYNTQNGYVYNVAPTNNSGVTTSGWMPVSPSNTDTLDANGVVSSNGDVNQFCETESAIATLQNMWDTGLLGAIQCVAYAEDYTIVLKFSGTDWYCIDARGNAEYLAANIPTANHTARTGRGYSCVD